MQTAQSSMQELPMDAHRLAYDFMPSLPAPEPFDVSQEPLGISQEPLRASASPDASNLPYAEKLLSSFQKEIDHQRQNHPDGFSFVAPTIVPMGQSAPLRTITDAKSESVSKF